MTSEERDKLIMEELIEGVWIPIEVFTPTDKFTSKELAEASLQIKRSLSRHLYQPLRIVKPHTPDCPMTNTTRD